MANAISTGGWFVRAGALALDSWPRSE